MEVVSGQPVSAKRAIHTLKKFTQDTFLEENDPDLSKSINMIYQNLMTTSYEISCPEISEQEQENSSNPNTENQVSETNQAETVENDSTAPETPKRRKHHKKSD